MDAQSIARVDNISLLPLAVGESGKAKQSFDSDTWPKHVVVGTESKAELGVKINCVTNDFHPKNMSVMLPVQEGGLRAWMTIAGAWMIQFSTFGYVYSYGVYQDYYTRIFLKNHSPSSIAWIGSIQLMMPLALGLVSGKLFDAGYFHHLIFSGSVIFTTSLFMVSLVQPDQYYQVKLLGRSFAKYTHVFRRSF